MINLDSKNIVIIEGADGTGKSQLAEFLKEQVSGKCHILHSNYNKSYPGENNFRQHLLMSKFATNQFKKKYYTGNRLVILDRNYISDMTYGKIGYGSKGSDLYKQKRLDRIFELLSRVRYTEDVQISLIYCRPEKSKFDETKNSREELLNDNENTKIQQIYNNYFKEIIPDLCKAHFIDYYVYDFVSDPNYKTIIGE